MKKSRLLFVLLGSIILCTACDGDVTRDIRHDGFNYGNEEMNLVVNIFSQLTKKIQVI